MKRASLDASGIAALRKALEGSRLLTEADRVLRFQGDFVADEATYRRDRAVALLFTPAAKAEFEALIEEGLARISFDRKARNAVVLLAHAVALAKDIAALEEGEESAA
jgi:S-adenosylmethionine:diacylglycerol 3-amino-3-carboxypropyl transferase